MGLTFASSFIRSKIVSHEQMLILEKSPEKAEKLKKLEIGTVYGEAGDYISEAKIIILAVKPQDINQLFPLVTSYIDESKNILSIMAGVTISQIKNGLGTAKIIRAMPNLPAQIGIGMTAFTATDEVTKVDLLFIQNLLSATGKTIYVTDEDKIDATTAISGSGPAYIFFFMQSMMKAARELGFSNSDADLLTYQTFRGAIELYNKYDLSCDTWIDKVSSKGGTTEAAFKKFLEKDISALLGDGIQAAYDRAKELSDS